MARCSATAPRSCTVPCTAVRKWSAYEGRVDICGVSSRRVMAPPSGTGYLRGHDDPFSSRLPGSMTRRPFSVACLAAALALPVRAQSPAPSSPPAPSVGLGITVGADRTLADWGQITGYFAKLAAASPAVKLDTLGPTTNGLPFVVAAISTPANVRRLEQLRANKAR